MAEGIFFSEQLAPLAVAPVFVRGISPRYVCSQTRLRELTVPSAENVYQDRQDQFW
ncbi:hypothetical protein [Streptosporangium sp. NPDC000396]|uniref:hypothetical protein n=1 Tax=Streptosporangium sp. NPDC000396 TaxID=3366185 RepID=UPI0036BA35F9